MKELKALILAVSVSLVVSAAIVSVGLSKIARSDRTVTVRGLAEKKLMPTLRSGRSHSRLEQTALRSSRKTFLQKLRP